MLQHVAVEVREAEVPGEVDFWAQLGFRRVDPPAALRHRAVWVQRGGQQIHLFLSDDPVVPRDGHVAVVVEDYERVRAAVGAQPREPHWGAARSFARTPAGHRVELMEAPPG